jgi:rhodanese-related sulfurtransferase
MTALWKRYLAFLVIPALLFVSSCSDDETTNPVTPTKSEVEKLIETLEGANGNYLKNDCPAIVTAQNVYEDLNGAKKFYIVDVRSAADYALGHVPGAVNVAIADILNHMKSVNVAQYDKIVIICYTGQSAAWTTAILRLSGYTKAFSMKFGMSSWNKDFDRITTNINSQYAGTFVKTETAKPAAGNLPTINTGKSTGEEILAARIAEVHGAGYSASSIQVANVMPDPTQYFIINYWPLAEYTGIGHIPGAIQYTPKSDLQLSAFLKTLPTDKTIVVYSYTGQTSANVAAVLRVMGYDAKSLSFGTQAMIWQTMKDAGKTHFDANVDCMNFDYEK